jgi:putative heme-binding domain-containing protein
MTRADCQIIVAVLVRLFFMFPSTHWGKSLLGIALATGHGLVTLEAAAPPSPAEDYNQWKEALGTNIATAASHIKPLPGFSVELIRSAGPGEGSWVALAFDPQGRVVIAREDRGLLRLTLPESASARIRLETINTNLLECRGLLFAHGALYANANNSKGLYRLRDSDGDDQFDEVMLIKATPGGVGHGRNQLALGPDGMIYSIHGDDVMLPPEGAAAISPLAYYGEDRLLPSAWDKHLFSAEVKMPCGHLIRTDRDGRTWGLVAGGFRNPYGIAFNADGDMFTFDADMEWDVGLPWYHATRVLHIVPGGDYGWRGGTGVLPVWSPDTLPSVVDIGLASPTAVMFGTKSHFPEPYRDALFILDWSYGRILAVHLTPTNATYTGWFEVFLKGRPLNVTGLDFGPDGAMYFVTGGRRTQSGLYRVRALQPAPLGIADEATAKRSNPAHVRRRTLEELRGKGGASRLDFVWEALNGDRWTQYAARTALESLPVSLWQERAFRESGSAATAPGAALLALARVGGRAVQARVREHLLARLAQPLTAEQHLMTLRGLTVTYLRHGRPGAIEAARAADVLNATYPSDDSRVNRQLCELLVYLEAPDVVGKTIPLLQTASTQEEKIQYLFLLRLVKKRWAVADRRAYFEALSRGRQNFWGANMLMTILGYIRADAEASLAPEERVALAEVLKAFDQADAVPVAPVPARAFLRDWSVSDFTDTRDSLASLRDLGRGQRLFKETGCAQCHRFGSDGGFIGPDLTAVGSRFDRRALLESILEPSKVIAEAYRTVSVTLKSGAILDGRIVVEDSSTLSIAINPVDPDQRRRVRRADIQTQRMSDFSPMPAGLINGLNREEVLDLLAFLERGAAAPPVRNAR